MIAMFNVIARKEGREGAYAFVKGVFEKVAVYSMPALYQVDELVECEGDVFDNFKKFNIAMFEAGAHMYRPTFTDEEDKLTIVIDKCANVDLAKAFDCPEVGLLGCDHDVAGYPVIEDRVNAEFRRPCTLAKDDKPCKFMFYRKGTAPDTEEIDGKTVKWEAGLNR